MLKKIAVAVSAGIILAALLIPAIAGNTVSISKMAIEKAEPIALTEMTPAPIRTN
ncbi:hypothetical protein KKB99_04025 [bacterium]|nr:hypothetical protein [bacterium]MBU1025161.1 hypothetical protein [bacterium]